MNPQEQENRLNNAEDESIINDYINQRAEFLSRADSEKQNEEKERKYMMELRNFLEEKYKIVRELDTQNELMQKTLEEEKIQHQELKEKITSTQQVMSSYIENFNQIRNLLQLYTNLEEEADVLKQEVLTDVMEKLNEKNTAKEKEYLEKISDLREFSKTCDEKHEKEIEQIVNMFNQLEERLKEIEQNIRSLQLQNITTKQERQRLNEEINKVEEKFNKLSNEYLKLQNSLETDMKEKEFEVNQFAKEITELEADVSKENEITPNSEIELSELQKEFHRKKEYLRSLEEEKESNQLSLLNSKTKLSNQSKIKIELNEKLQEKRKNCDEKKNILQKQLEEVTETNQVLEKDNKILEQENNEIETELNDFKNQLDNVNADLAELEIKSKQTETILDEQSLKFEAEIEVLKKNNNDEIQIENNNISLKHELEVKLNELNKQHEELIAQKERILAAAEEDEVTANITIESVKDEIIKEKYQAEKIETRTLAYENEENYKIEKMKQDFEDKIKNKNLEFDNLKSKLTEHRQNTWEIISDELRKLKESKITFELQFSELKASTQSLQNELISKTKEYELLEQELNNLNNKESNREDSDIKQDLKRVKYNSKIPKMNIPPPKYSSTSDSSNDERPLTKRRKTAAKRRNDKNNDMDYTTEAPRSGKESTRPKKSIKKPVF